MGPDSLLGKECKGGVEWLNLKAKDVESPHILLHPAELLVQLLGVSVGGQGEGAGLGAAVLSPLHTLQQLLCGVQHLQHLSGDTAQ